MGQKLETNSFHRYIIFQPILRIIWKAIGLLLVLTRALLAENNSNQKQGFFILFYFSLNDEKQSIYGYRHV